MTFAFMNYHFIKNLQKVVFLSYRISLNAFEDRARI
jgi:hypothetical protein